MVHILWFTLLPSSHFSREPVNHGSHSTVAPCFFYKFILYCIKGLESHPQHALYKREFRGYGGMISFYVKTDLEGIKTFVKALKVCFRI